MIVVPLPTALAVALLAAGGTYLLGKHHGAEAERDANRLREAKAYQAGVDLGVRIERGVAQIGAQLREQLATSRTAEASAVRTVTRIVRENPDYAAVRRPADLQRVRDEQLARIAEAAAAD